MGAESRRGRLPVAPKVSTDIHVIPSTSCGRHGERVDDRSAPSKGSARFPTIHKAHYYDCLMNNIYGPSTGERERQ